MPPLLGGVKAFLNDEKKPNGQTADRRIPQRRFVHFCCSEFHRANSGDRSCPIVCIGRSFTSGLWFYGAEDIISFRPAVYPRIRAGSKSLIAARYFIFRFAGWMSSPLIIGFTTRSNVTGSKQYSTPAPYPCCLFRRFPIFMNFHDLLASSPSSFSFSFSLPLNHSEYSSTWTNTMPVFL